MNINIVKASLLILALVLPNANLYAQEENSDLSDPPELIFVAYPREVLKNKKVNLEWNSDGDYCMASGGWSGRLPSSGSKTVKVSKNSKFSLQCFNDDGTSSNVQTSTVKVVKKTKKPSRNLVIKQFSWHDEFGNQYLVVRSGNKGEIRWIAPGTIACKASSNNEDWSGLLASSGEREVTAEDNDRFVIRCIAPDGTLTSESIIPVETAAKTTKEDILKNISIFPAGIVILQDPRPTTWESGVVARGTQAQIMIEVNWNGSYPVNTLDLWEIPFATKFDGYSKASVSYEGFNPDPSQVKVISPGGSFSYQFDGNFPTIGARMLEFTLGEKKITKSIQVKDCSTTSPGDRFMSCKD